MLGGLTTHLRLSRRLALPSDAVFLTAMANTLKYLDLAVPTGLVLSLAIALALARVKRLAGLFRTVYFIPFITSLVAVSWVWRWLCQPQRGTLNVLLSMVGIPPQRFLHSTSQALPSIVAVNVWHDLGFQIVIFLAGLSAIPDVYYEAARLDGAGRWDLFRHITVPLLKNGRVTDIWTQFDALGMTQQLGAIPA